MKKLILFFAIFLLPWLAYSKGTDSWLGSYRGNFGDSKGGLALVFDGDDVSGELYFDSEYKDIPLSGKIRNERDIELVGEEGLILKGVTSGSGKEQIKGIITWNDGDNAFYVSRGHGGSGDLKHKYSIAGFDNDQELEGFAGKFKKVVLSGNKEQVSKMLRYPIEVSLRSGNTKNLQSLDEFLNLYDEIFYPGFIEAFKEAIPHNMFAKHLGVMMSSDDNTFWVWFVRLEPSEEKKIGVLSIFSDTDKLRKSKP